MDRTKTTIETYNLSAQHFADKFMEMTLYNETYDSFCNFIQKENAKIFEIACGPGNVTKYILNRRPDFKITGIDLAPKMVELASQNIPNAEFFVMDCRDIDSIEMKFDAIMCGFCLPYLSKAESAKLIAGTYELLNSGGILYLSTMEDNYDRSGFETTSFSGENLIFIYYHQSEYLLEQLRMNGFKVIEQQRKNYPESDGSFTTDLIIIAQK